MAETSVPMPKNGGLDFRIRTPSVAGAPLVPAMSSFPGLLAPPEPAVSSPSKTNELLQLSEALAELNPSLRQSGLSVVRKFATDAEQESKLAYSQMSPEDIGKINRMSQDEIVKNGILPSGALPSFYVNVQKLAAENEVNKKYQQFVLENYWPELSNPVSTKQIPEILGEARAKFFESWGNESAFGRLSGYSEAEKMDRQLANNAFQSRFAARQVKLDEESGIAGSRILFESLSPELPADVRASNIVGFLDGEYKRGNPKAAVNFINKSVQPYINRIANENPAQARQYLTFLEGLELPTGAKLGEVGFGDFQNMQRYVDQQEAEGSRKGVLDLATKKTSIQDLISLYFSEYSREVPPDSWSQATKREIADKIIETDYVPLYGKDGALSHFSLKEDRFIHGFVYDSVSQYFDKYKKDDVKADPQVMSDLSTLNQEGDVEGFLSLLEQAKTTDSLGNYESRFVKMGQDLKAGTAVFRMPSVSQSKANIRGAFRSYFTNDISLDKDYKDSLQSEINAKSTPLFNRTLRESLTEAQKAEENKGKPLDILVDEILPGIENKVIQELQQEANKKNSDFIRRQDKLKQIETKAQPEPGNGNDKMPGLPSAFGFSKGDDIAHGVGVPPLNYIQKMGDRVSWIQRHFEKVGITDVSALSPEDRKVYSGWLKIRKEEMEKIDVALGTQRSLLAKDLILKAFPRTKGGVADYAYSPDQLAERTARYWKVVELDGLSPEEILKGTTDEKIPLPLKDPMSPIRILTPHFRSTTELNTLFEQGKTSDGGMLEQVFEKLGIDPNNQAEVDQYMMEQRRLLYIRGR